MPTCRNLLFVFMAIVSVGLGQDQVGSWKATVVSFEQTKPHPDALQDYRLELWLKVEYAGPEGVMGPGGTILPPAIHLHYPDFPDDVQVELEGTSIRHGKEQVSQDNLKILSWFGSANYRGRDLSDSRPLKTGETFGGLELGYVFKPWDHEWLTTDLERCLAREDAEAITQRLEENCGKDARNCGPLAYRYLHSDYLNELSKDVSKAIDLYQRACATGSLQSCSDLAWIYRQGNGVGKDPTKAVEFFNKACNAGDPFSCYALGDIYGTGEGVPRDPIAAEAIVKRGCDLAHTSYRECFPLQELNKQRKKKSG